MRRVYFIRPIGMNGPVKIGCSYRPEQRSNALDTWSPFPLEIVAEIGGDFAIERRFHALFKGSHQRREWFNWTPEMESVIEQINAGTFDLSSLPPPQFISNRYEGNKIKRTPVQCRQFSMSIRDSYRSRKSGYSCPVRVCGASERNDPAELAAIEQFLADPASNGIPIDAPWAAARRAAYHAKHPAKAAA